MKVVHCIGIALILGVTLTGCKNRLETYEPYDTYDERMAAAESARPYAPENAYGDQFADAEPSAPQQRSMSASASQNAEVPFSSSRGEKHAVNIGAID